MPAKRNIYFRPLLVIALGFLAGAMAYPYIPSEPFDQIRWARVQIAFSLPSTMLIIYLLFCNLWRHDRVRTGNGSFEATYRAIVFRALLFVFSMHALLMIGLTDAMDTFGTRQWGKRVVVVMLGTTIIAIGNLLPRLRPNIAFGVRTARTLGDTTLWQQVHRMGGYATVALGIAVLVGGVAATSKTAEFVLLFAGVAAGFVFLSYRKYANA